MHCLWNLDFCILMSMYMVAAKQCSTWCQLCAHLPSWSHTRRATVLQTCWVVHIMHVQTKVTCISFLITSMVSEKQSDAAFNPCHYPKRMHILPSFSLVHLTKLYAVLFDDSQNSSRKLAFDLQDEFAQAFGISATVNPTFCDDINTTHGASPPLCMIDNDWGHTNYSLGS